MTENLEATESQATLPGAEGTEDAILDPNATPGESLEDTPADNQGLSLEDVPEEYRSLVEGKMREVDRAATKKFEELAEKRRGLESLEEENAQLRQLLQDPDTLEFMRKKATGQVAAASVRHAYSDIETPEDWEPAVPIIRKESVNGVLEVLAPVFQQFQELQKTVAELKQGTSQSMEQQWYSAHPEAVPFKEEIEAQLHKYPNMSLDEALQLAGGEKLWKTKQRQADTERARKAQAVQPIRGASTRQATGRGGGSGGWSKYLDAAKEQTGYSRLQR